MQVLSEELDSLLRSEEWDSSLASLTRETDFAPEDWQHVMRSWKEHNKMLA